MASPTSWTLTIPKSTTSDLMTKYYKEKFNSNNSVNIFINYFKPNGLLAQTMASMKGSAHSYPTMTASKELTTR
uniref:Uncharacterized protein n=1 Tax=Acrobeloides nanus TaxID=290746 RepID=A0A914CXH0_9BILA